MRVVLTREEGSNDSLRSFLPEDAEVVEVPLTETRFFDDQEVRGELERLARKGSYRALVVTSARSALYVNLARAALAPNGRVLSVGTKTAQALEDGDVVVDVVGEGGAADLAAEIEHGPVLLLGALVMREELAQALRERGVAVDALACYETVPVALDEARRRALREADVLFIGAPSAWHAASYLVRPSTWVVVPGSTTARIVREEHERVIEGWVPALRERLRSL